jgi:EAL domain-containing protein (putative c-di-GMP-specific phosphodiesterase class I)
VSRRPLWDLIVEPEGLSTLFQPIFELGAERHVFALEALTRGPKDTNVERSDVLFEYVRRKRKEVQVDVLAIAAAFRQARGLPVLPGLCLNVHAATLEEEPRLPQWLVKTAAEYEITRERVVIEIVEHAPPWSGRQFLASLDALRYAGIRIALDDVGLGQSSFRMIVDCRPDLLKIDRHFVAGAHADGYRRAVLESIADLACRLGARAVAEGIEEEADLEVVRRSGIDLAQGYLLCRPCASKALRKMDFMKPPVQGAAPRFEDPIPTQDLLHDA